MRTTVEIRDDLFQVLKLRAGLRRQSLRQVLEQALEAGLKASAAVAGTAVSRVLPPPVVVGRTPMRTWTNKDLHEFELREDLERLNRADGLRGAQRYPLKPKLSPKRRAKRRAANA